MAIKGGKTDDRRIAPNIIVRNPTRAIEFYEKVLGAEPIYVSRRQDGSVMHAQLKVGETVMLVTEENMGMPEADFARFEQGQRTRSPETLKGTSVVLEIYVDNVDEAFRKAIDAGARPKMDVSDTFYGDRICQIEDPFGHVWGLGEIREVLEPEEVDRRARAMFARAD